MKQGESWNIIRASNWVAVVTTLNRVRGRAIWGGGWSRACSCRVCRCTVQSVCCWCRESISGGAATGRQGFEVCRKISVVAQWRAQLDRLYAEKAIWAILSWRQNCLVDPGCKQRIAEVAAGAKSRELISPQPSLSGMEACRTYLFYRRHHKYIYSDQ